MFSLNFSLILDMLRHVLVEGCFLIAAEFYITGAGAVNRVISHEKKLTQNSAHKRIFYREKSETEQTDVPAIIIARDLRYQV